MIEDKILNLLNAYISRNYLDAIRMLDELKESMLKLHNDEENK